MLFCVHPGRAAVREQQGLHAFARQGYKKKKRKALQIDEIMVKFQSLL